MPEVTNIRLANPSTNINFSQQVSSGNIAKKEVPEIKLGTEIIGEETNPTPTEEDWSAKNAAQAIAQNAPRIREDMQGLANQLEQASLTDPRAAHEARYRLEHQLAYFDSAEYAVRAQRAVAAYNQEYSKMLTPLEAEKLTKELGVDIKYDKNVQEGTVRFNADETKLRKSIEDQLNEYRQTENSTLLQDCSYTWAHISGLVGFFESFTLITILCIIIFFSINKRNC